MSKHNEKSEGQPQQVAAPAAAEKPIEKPQEPAIVPPAEPKNEEVKPEAPAEVEAPKVEPVKAEPPKTVPVKEPVKKFAAPKAPITTAEILVPKSTEGNAFARRRAMNALGGGHTMIGNKLIQQFDAYKARMSKSSNDKEENKVRIKMLQDILNTACPQNPMDLQTATDVSRIMFDKLMEGWGTVYTDSTIFRMGETLRGTAYDLDKLVMFIEAYVQMIEGAIDKKPIMFDDGRLGKILKNPNMVIAMGRIRDNVNKRNGFIKK